MHVHAPRILAVALLASGCGLATGASKNTTFAVSATVVGNCIIDLATTMAFDDYVQGAGDVNQTSTIAVRCTSGTSYGIGLSVGTGGGSFAQRTMSRATATSTSRLEYNLYTAALPSNIWRDAGARRETQNTQGGTGTGLANVINHTVYGRLQDSATSRAAAPGNDYTSTITVTLNY
jgi:spore coat protein U-like protein